MTGEGKLGLLRTKWLAALCLGLTLSLIVTLVRSPNQTGGEIGARRAPTASAATSPPRSLPPFGRFQDIAADTIFRPTRRPPLVKKTAKATSRPASTVLAPPPSLVLLGIVIGPAQRAALLRLPGTPKTVLLTKGKTIQGWTLDEIADDKVTLDQGARHIDLAFPASTLKK